jgi:hypothetical protein
MIAGPMVPLKAHVQIGKKPIELKIHQHCSVTHVIECIIQAWKAAGRTPLMKENSDFYELRVLDDDDGTPDTDMQPLDRYLSTALYHIYMSMVVHLFNRIGVIVVGWFGWTVVRVISGAMMLVQWQYVRIHHL